MGTIVFEDPDGGSVTWNGADERIRYDDSTDHWVLVTGEPGDLLHRMIPRERVFHVDTSERPDSVIR